MNATERRKQAWLEERSSEMLERVVTKYTGPETASPEYPLGGLVFFEGIGQIKLSAIRQELNRRGVETP